MKKTLKLKLANTEVSPDSKPTEEQTTQIAQTAFSSQLSAETKSKLKAAYPFLTALNSQRTEAILGTQLSAEAKTKIQATLDSHAATFSQNEKLEIVNFPDYLMHTQERHIQAQKQSMEQINREKESVKLLKEIKENLKNPLHSISNENYQQNYEDLKAENEKLKVENESLKKQCNDDLHPRERNTLLKIIAVMAKDGYNNDLSEPYGEISKIISTEAQLLGFSITAETIGDKLKLAKQFLDSN